jgi:hypothetical protein
MQMVKKKDLSAKLEDIARRLEIEYGLAHVKNLACVQTKENWQADRQHAFSKLPGVIATIRAAAKEAKNGV